MKKSEHQMLLDIHKRLIGDLDEQGFIGEVSSKFVNLESRLVRIESWKKTKVGLLVTAIGALIVEAIKQ